MSEDRMQGIPQGNILRDRRVQGREATIIAEQARALAESQAAELREEVRQLKIDGPLTVEGIEGPIDEIRTRNTRIAELEAALERQQRAVTDEEWDNRPSVEAGPSYWPRLITAILATRSREQEPGK